jgi:isoleucyl-tRNA synthetase
MNCSMVSVWSMATRSTAAGGIDLHKPWVDEILFEKTRCHIPPHSRVDRCLVRFRRNAFRTIHYPFENRELFEKSFPADFICEGIDQTRGWFYTLHAISSALFDKPAFGI